MARLLAPLLALLIGLGLPGPGLAQTPVEVAMVDLAFEPPMITIPAGTRVTWVNNGLLPHTATGPGFDSGELGPGQSYSFIFTQAGTVAYVCTVLGHQEAGMVGTVNVQAGGAAAPALAPVAAPPAAPAAPKPAVVPAASPVSAAVASPVAVAPAAVPVAQPKPGPSPTPIRPATTTPAPRAGGFPMELAFPLLAGGGAALGGGVYLLRRSRRR